MKKLLSLNFLLLLFIAPGHYVISQEDKNLSAKACCSAVIVEDLREAIKWYTEALNFKTVTEFRNEDRGIAIANLKLGSTRLELIEIANSLSPDSLKTKPDPVQGLFKFGLTVSAFDTWLEHLSSFVPDIKTQVVKDPLNGKRMVVIRDPDGNRIQIFED